MDVLFAKHSSPLFPRLPTSVNRVAVELRPAAREVANDVVLKVLSRLPKTNVTRSEVVVMSRSLTGIAESVVTEERQERGGRELLVVDGRNQKTETGDMEVRVQTTERVRTCEANNYNSDHN